MDENVSDNPAQQAFNGNDLQPAYLSRQKRKQRRQENRQPDCAQRLGYWRNNFSGAEPAYTQPGGKNGNEKCSDSEKLKHQIGN